MNHILGEKMDTDVNVQRYFHAPKRTDGIVVIFIGFPIPVLLFILTKANG